MADSDEVLQNEAGNSAVLDGNGSSSGAEQDFSSAKSFEDMRSSPRKRYQYNQRIAPLHGDFLPQPDDYFNVECNDISQGGISFFLKRPPGCERFAIVLGQKPTITTLIGRVVYSREVKHRDERMYLVGCQFTGRLEV
jgi:hypothetical protein